MADIENLIDYEVKLYVSYCRLACLHDKNEELYKDLAHMIFYHIQEMRTTGKITILDQLPTDTDLKSVARATFTKGMQL